MRNLKNNPKTQKAFTLIEIIITTAILVIVTTILVVNFRYQAPKDALNQGAEQVITYFRQAQTATFTGLKVGIISPDYGLYLSTAASQKNQVIVFADLNRGKDYNLGEADPANCFSCGTFTLPTNIEISSLNPTSASSLTITFSATNTDEVYLNTSLATADGQITLTNTQTSETTNLTIYYSNAQISR